MDKMPDVMWAVDGGDTDHAEFRHGTWNNSPTYGVGIKAKYHHEDTVRELVEALEELLIEYELHKDSAYCDVGYEYNIEKAAHTALKKFKGEV